jgi:hypothetical protein
LLYRSRRLSKDYDRADECGNEPGSGGIRFQGEKREEKEMKVEREKEENPFVSFRRTNFICVVLFTILIAATPVQAKLTFTIDTFTPNEISITIPVGPATLDQTGVDPWNASLFLIDTSAVNSGWILDSNDATYSGGGQLGAALAVPGKYGLINDNVTAGDIMRITFDKDLTAGATVGTAVTATVTGVNIFDPTQVDSLLLTWGTKGVGVEYPFGSPQNSTVTTLVHLEEFMVRGGADQRILWRTASELDTAGFYIWRSVSREGPFVVLNESIVASEGSPSQGASYEYIDEGCPTRDCCYKLEDIDTAGQSTMHGPSCVEPLAPFCGTSANPKGLNHLPWILLPAVAILWWRRRKGESLS